MPWEGGHYRVDHPREPWSGTAGESQILAHCRWPLLKGTDPSLEGQTATYHAAYLSAKREFNLDIAFEIVERCVDSSVMDQIADIVFYSGKMPKLVFPHLGFDDEDSLDGQKSVTDQPTNALPFAYAEYLSQTLGCPIETGIIQHARVGRTKLTKMRRFLCRPMFKGPVETNQPYILLDDVVTTAGTFAALRSYLVENGGTVAGMTALAHESGGHQIFPVADQTLTMLRQTYGGDLGSFWKETFGHELTCLTQGEAESLVQVEGDDFNWEPGESSLQRLRRRIDQTAAN